MKLFLAAYDPAHDSSTGNYWVWAHKDLPPALLNDFYYTVATKNISGNPNELSAADWHGGWAAVDETWTCWYRFLNGGRDLRGRPGRFVILCAFCRREDTTNRNVFGILDHKVFQELAKAAPSSRPIPKPAKFPDLEVDVEFPPLEVLQNSYYGIGGDSFTYTGSDATEKASRTCADLPRDCRFNCKVTRQAGEIRIVVDIPPFRNLTERTVAAGIAPPFIIQGDFDRDLPASSSPDIGGSSEGSSGGEHEGRIWLRQPVQRGWVIIAFVIGCLVGGLCVGTWFSTRSGYVLLSPSVQQKAGPPSKAISPDAKGRQGLNKGNYVPESASTPKSIW